MKILLPDSWYNFLKWFSIGFIPAFETLILTVGKIWLIPYYTEIGATVGAIGVFAAAVLGISCANYDAGEIVEMHPDDEGGAEG